MSDLEYWLGGAGILFAIIGQCILLTKNGAQSSEQLTVLSQAPKDNKVGILFLVAFSVSKNISILTSVVYVSAGLFILSPIYDLYRLYSFVGSSGLTHKTYYRVAFSVKYIGFMLLFIGGVFWALQI